jgi:hypothetical protein
MTKNIRAGRITAVMFWSSREKLMKKSPDMPGSSGMSLLALLMLRAEKDRTWERVARFPDSFMLLAYR